jgi:hypothetical protein
MMKPKVKLVGTNGNIFNTLAICSKALKASGQPEKAQELQEKVFSAHSYDEALAACLTYVEAS